MFDISKLTYNEKPKEFTIDSQKITYQRIKPKLSNLKTEEEFKIAEEYIKEQTGFKDDEFIKLLARASYADKSLLPTEKDIRNQRKKMIKKLNKK